MKEVAVAVGTRAYDEVVALYEEAFVPEERVDTSVLLAAAERDGVAFTAYYDEDVFCGFTYAIDADPYLYLLFFAVPAELRSHGYGTRVMQRLHEHHADRVLVLEIEPLDECAQNYDQRVRRLAFYERNGLSPTGYSSYEDDMVYTVLATQGDFDERAYMDAVERATHGIICPDVRRS